MLGGRSGRLRPRHRWALLPPPLRVPAPWGPDSGPRPAATSTGRHRTRSTRRSDTTTKLPIAAAVTAWADASGPEDLALWSESATTTSNTYNMNGGGVFNVRGVFMVPNADPFKLSGGAGMNLTNAQYICSSIELNGGTQITMKVDPNSAVVLPELDLRGVDPLAMNAHVSPDFETSLRQVHPSP